MRWVCANGGIAGPNACFSMIPPTEQLARAHRYLKRIRTIYSEAPHIGDAGDYHADDIFSFFIHCHHIGDWIATLNFPDITYHEVHSFIRFHPELCICSDMSNIAKHNHLTKRTKTRCRPYLSLKARHTADINEVVSGMRGYLIVVGEHSYDALELAETCMKLWDWFVADLEKTAKVEKSTSATELVPPPGDSCPLSQSHALIPPPASDIVETSEGTQDIQQTRIRAVPREQGGRAMSKEYIEVHLEFTRDPDPDCPYIACPAIPHAGDIIITDSGRRYRVRAITFDAQSSGVGEPCRVIASVKPVQAKQPKEPPQK